MCMAKRQHEDRDRELWGLYLRGQDGKRLMEKYSQGELAKRYGISRQRVGQILRRMRGKSEQVRGNAR